MEFNRRSFLWMGGSILVARSAPSDQIGLGVIGSGGRGTLVMTIFQKDQAVRVSAICDVYEPNLQNALSEASKVPGNRPKAYRHYKENYYQDIYQKLLLFKHRETSLCFS